MVKPKTFYVRVKPYNKKRGYLIRNYMIRGVRFTTRWKEISAAKANLLQYEFQPHDVEEEIPIFDIKSESEALAIEADDRDKNGGHIRPDARVKEAERIPDRKFRDDKPRFDDETGEITSDHVEAAETVDQPVETEPDAVELAPKVKSPKKSPRARARK